MSRGVFSAGALWGMFGEGSQGDPMRGEHLGALGGEPLELGVVRGWRPALKLAHAHQDGARDAHTVEAVDENGLSFRQDEELRWCGGCLSGEKGRLEDSSEDVFQMRERMAE